MGKFWGKRALAAGAALALVGGLAGVATPALATASEATASEATASEAAGSGAPGGNASATAGAAPRSGAELRADAIALADPELAACVNKKLGSGRAPDAPISRAEIESVTVLSCSSDFAVTSLDGFEAAVEMRTLTFLGGKHDLSGPGALNALIRLPKLSSLTLTDAGLTDDSLGTISGAGSLSRLTIAGNAALTSLGSLATLTKLTNLDASRNPGLTDFGALAQLTALRDLNLGQSTQLADLEPLRGLTKLSSINAQMTGVSSLAPLAGLTELTSLTVSFTDVDSLEPLAALDKLAHLTVSRAKITSLAGIEGADGLKTLDIDHNPGLGDDIGAIAGKQQLYRIHMDAIGATTLEPLRDLPALRSLQAQGNQISSLVGLPEAPANRADGTLAVTAQQIRLGEVHVPRGAKKFRADITGELSLRDGSTFPSFGGNQAPALSPELPFVDITIYSAIPTAEYTFSQTNALDNDRFTGTVFHPIVWSTITSADSATIPYGEPWEQQTTVTPGFPASSHEIAPLAGSDAPDWLSIDRATGLLSGTPVSYGSWTFELRVADPLGNEMRQRMDLSVPQPDPSIVELGEDQTGLAGDTLTFTVTRAPAAPGSYSGAADVTVATQDGPAGSEDPALAGTHYEAHEETLSWAAGDMSPRTVTVQTLPTAAGDPDRHFTLELRDPQPQNDVQIGAGVSADATIQAPVPVENEFEFTGPQRALAGSELTFEVSRSQAAVNPWTGEASVTASTRDASAVAGEHYVARTETLTWAADDFAPKPFAVETLETDAGGPERTLSVELSDPSRFTAIGEVGAVTGEIVAPDPELTVFALDGDQHGVAGDTIEFQVSRINAAELPWLGATSVDVRTVDESAEAGEHYEEVPLTTLTWAAGDTAPQTVRVPTSAVPAGDPDRSFRVELSSPGAHGEFGHPAVATGTITAETPEPSLLAVHDAAAVRAGGDAVFEVTRSDAAERAWTGPVTVRVTTVDGTARAGTHFTAVDIELRWEAGDDAPQQVRVPTTAGFAGDAARGFTVALSEPSEHAEAGGPAGIAAGAISYAKLPPVDPGDGGTDGGTDGSTDGSTDGGTGKPKPGAPGTGGLAETGGPDLALPLTLGAAALLAAGALLITRRRGSAEE